MFHVLFTRQVLYFSAGSIHKQQISLQRAFYASLHPLQTVARARSIPLYNGVDRIHRLKIFSTTVRRNDSACGPKGNRLVFFFVPQLLFSTTACVRNVELYHLILWNEEDTVSIVRGSSITSLQQSDITVGSLCSIKQGRNVNNGTVLASGKPQ